MHNKRSFGRQGLLAILICLSCSCAGQGSNSGYRVQIPVLDVAPKQGPCKIQDPDALTFLDGECVTLTTKDFGAILVELIAACLALGGTEQECRAK